MIPICECGYAFHVSDIGLCNDGPDNRIVLQCPDCHCITEYDAGEVDL